MALTRADVEMWKEIAPLVPPAPRVLEIGQANWYNDVPPHPDDADPDLHTVARKFYGRMMPGAAIGAIDRHGTPGRFVPWDLNAPLPEDFDWTNEVVINTGTCEHIFDQRQVFKTIHDACAVRGLMIHAAPLSGWWEHGFYLYNPTFFADLQAANGYELVYLSQFDFTRGIVTRLATYAWARQQPGDQMLYVVWRKKTDRPFEVPMQGRYKR